MKSAKRSGGKGKGREFGVRREELMGREALYAVLCKKNDYRVVRG